MEKSKIGKIVLDTLLYIFLAISIFSVFITVLSKRDADGAAEVFGYQMRVVTSDSMAESEFTDVSAYKIKDIPIRSMVFIKAMPDEADKADDFYRSLKIGDVLTFRYVYTTQVTITHRITYITEKDTVGFIIELAGDNKNSEDGQLVQVIDTSIPNNTNYVIGKVTGQSYSLGLLMSFLMQPVAIVLLIIVPCFIIISLEVLKITKVLSADKKKREQEEKEEKEKELEELRRKLAELEKEKNELNPPKPTVTDINDNEENKEDKTE
ncbi:MAG: hypothetical protein IKB51_05260 [Clostridia bacterium]|nr:hypothetical protein [Clostridia bacterium]